MKKNFIITKNIDFFSCLNFFECLKWFVLFSLLICKGFGNAFLMKIGVILPLGFFLVNACSQGKYQRALISILLLCLIFTEWPLVHLWGYWVFASLACLGKTNRYANALASAFLSFWLLQETELGSWTVIPIYALPIFLILILLGSKFKSLVYPLIIACIFYTSYTVVQNHKKNYVVQIAQDTGLAKGYSPGPVLAKILNSEIVKPGQFSGDVGISSLIFDKGPFDSKQLHILLAEHDLEFDDEIVLSANAQQKEPWIFNQMFGNQYILEAISRDGCWMGNLGGSLLPCGKLLLGSYSHFGTDSFTPLVIKFKSFIYVQDSDSFVDRVASRQVQTVTEITLERALPRIINIVFCLLSLLLFSSCSTCIVVCMIINILILLKMPTVGDVRINANIDWPHEPSKASGVLASLTDAGFYYLKGDVETKILIVGKGNTSIALPSEHLIVLEPDSSVYLKNHIIKAGKEPLGQTDHSVDARLLYIDGTPTRDSIIIDDIRIIGSGSPAKIDWRKWLTINP